jgi:outer membrane receptor protein involved in Fe transport
LRCALPVAASCWSLLAASPIAAQTAPSLAIAASPLPVALDALSRQTGVSIGAEGSLPAPVVGPLHGRMSAEMALRRLLQGTGLIARRVGANAYRVERLRVEPPVVAATTPTVPPASALVGLPIIVTAGKRPQPLDELPLDVSVVRFPIGAATGRPVDSESVSASIEGLTLTGLGSGRNRMFVRGVADSSFSGTTQSTVAVVLDDSRVTYSAPDPDLRLIDVDRVEVIKGPQGSLYGSGTLGGIYHIVTRPPDLGATSGQMSAGVSTVGDGDVAYQGSAVLNVPIAQNRLGLRLVAYNERTPGWINTGNRTNSNALRISGGRAGLLWRAGNWDAHLTVQVQRTTSDDSQYVYAANSLRRPAQLAEPHDNDFDHLAVKVTGPIGGWQLQLIAAMTWHEVGDASDATIGADQFGLANPQLFTDDRRYRVWDNEARLDGSWRGAEWLIGLSHIESRLVAQQVLTASAPGSALTGAAIKLEDDRSDTRDTAFFVNATIPVLPGMSTTVGARLFRTSSSQTLKTPGGVLDRNVDHFGLTPAIALSWHPRPHRMVFLRYASAMRPGGLGLSQIGARQPFEGDEMGTLEGGLRQDIVGGRIDVSGYATWWDNLQSDVLLSNGLLETRNAGQARIFGVELLLNHELGTKIRMEFGATAQRALLVRNALGIALEDRRLPSVPDYTLRSDISHDISIGRHAGAVVLRMRFVGPSRLSFDPGIDRRMGSAMELGVLGHFNAGTWILAGEVGNIANGRTNVFAYGNPFRLRTMLQFTPQRPINLKVSVTKTF